MEEALVPLKVKVAVESIVLFNTSVPSHSVKRPAAVKAALFKYV